MPLDDSTYGECDEPRLTDDRRLQDMIDATPCVVIDFLLAHDMPGRRRLPFRALLETGHEFTTDSHDSEAARRGGDAPRQTDEDKSRAADHPEIHPSVSRAGERVSEVPVFGWR